MARKKLDNTGDTATIEEVVTLDDLDPNSESEAAPSTAPEAPEGEDGQRSSDHSSQEAPEEANEEESNIDEADIERALKREFNNVLKDLGKIGVAYGKGKTSMISFAERLTEAAMTGAIGPKDALKLYDRFREAADNAAMLDDNANPIPDAAVNEKPATVDPVKSKDQQLTKVRSFIKLGNRFKNDGVQIVRTARNVHLRMLSTVDRKAIKPGSTYTILCSVATEQCAVNGKAQKWTKPMSESDIEAYLSVDVPETTPADGAKKVMDALIAATAAHKGGRERGPVDDPALVDAIDALRTVLGRIAPDRLAEHDAKANKADNEGAPEVATAGASVPADTQARAASEEEAPAPTQDDVAAEL